MTEKDDVIETRPADEVVSPPKKRTVYVNPVENKAVLDNVATQKALLDNGIAVFEQLYQRLTSQLDRANAALESIQKSSEEQGVVIPDLDKAMKVTNNLRVFKSKLDKYMSEIKNEGKAVEERFAILSVMVELSDAVNDIENIN